MCQNEANAEPLPFLASSMLPKAAIFPTWLYEQKNPGGKNLPLGTNTDPHHPRNSDRVQFSLAIRLTVVFAHIGRATGADNVTRHNLRHLKLWSLKYLFSHPFPPF